MFDPNDHDPSALPLRESSREGLFVVPPPSGVQFDLHEESVRRSMVLVVSHQFQTYAGRLVALTNAAPRVVDTTSTSCRSNLARTSFRRDRTSHMTSTK